MKYRAAINDAVEVTKIAVAHHEQLPNEAYAKHVAKFTKTLAEEIDKLYSSLNE